MTIMLVYVKTCWKCVYDSRMTFQDGINVCHSASRDRSDKAKVSSHTCQFGVTAVDKSMSRC